MSSRCMLTGCLKPFGRKVSGATVLTWSWKGVATSLTRPAPPWTWRLWVSATAKRTTSARGWTGCTSASGVGAGTSPPPTAASGSLNTKSRPSTAPKNETASSWTDVTAVPKGCAPEYTLGSVRGGAQASAPQAKTWSSCRGSDSSLPTAGESFRRAERQSGQLMASNLPPATAVLLC